MLIDHFMASPGSFATLLATAEKAPNERLVELYRTWIDVQGPMSPHLYAAWFNLGVELENSGDGVSALQAYRQAVALRPDFVPAVSHLARLLEYAGALREAIAIVDAALQPDEARIALINHRARALEQVRRLDEAEEELLASLRIRPDQPDVIQHFLHVRQKSCAWPILPEPDFAVRREAMICNAGPLSALALFDDVRLQRDICRRWIDRKTTAPTERLSPSDGYRHDRIRLGYLSSDFCQHAMSLLIAELFERHDRGRFEVYGYCSSPEDGSATRDRVIAAFDRFTRIADLSDEAAARRIRADEIDILIDLNGLTAGARLQILRWRPAPVQATYLGFIGPVPLPELDYLFCDRFVIPKAQAALYQPRPLPVATIYQANDSRRERPAPALRAALGLPEDRFVFCCFSNHYKITEPVFAAWLTILSRVERGVLWLIADSAASRANLLATASAAGVDPARLVFTSRVSPTAYLASLAAADLFLDTFPYNAGTIASDCIRMGLPLVTVTGHSFVARMAGRLLTAIGAEDGITDTLESYIDTAVALATEPERYARFRSRFTEDIWRTTLGDIATFTDEYETTLRGIVLTPANHPPREAMNPPAATSPAAATSARLHGANPPTQRKIVESTGVA